MRVEERVVLDRSVETAWDALVDWERQAEWMADADWVRVDGKREGVGVRLRVKTRLYDVPALTERLVVTGWDPPRRLQIEHRSIVKGTGEWRLEPEGSGSRFTWTEDVTLPVVGDLVAGVYRPFLEKMMRSSLANFARFVQRSGD